MASGVKREAGAQRLHRRCNACAAPATVSGSGTPWPMPSTASAATAPSGAGRRGLPPRWTTRVRRRTPRARIPAFAIAFGRCGSAFVRV